MSDHKFKPEFLNKLNNPNRLKDLPPDVIFSKFKVEKPELILDIGAGTGFFSIQLAQYYPSAKILACDISNEMLHWINENVLKDHNSISTHLMEENQIPFQENFADILIMVNLHHELDDPILMLKECYRVLKPGGQIMIVDWKKEEMPMGPPLEIRCDPQEISRQLTITEFTNVLVSMELQYHFLILGQKL
ncbi:MAG: class I SAM-dependent methyltransferase [Deltaproteobacteria bacterium]